MSNTTDSGDEIGFDRPVVLGPAIAVAGILVILLGIAVFLFVRNRQARITRLRERVGLAECRVNALLKIQQMTEVKRGVNKQSSDEISKQKGGSHENIRDNDGAPSVNTQCTQQTKLSQSIDQPLTSASHRTTEWDFGPHGAHLQINGHGALGSSLESLDNASHVAVVNQSICNSNTHQGYLRGEMQNTDNKRPSLYDVMDMDRGYSSTLVERWV